MYHCEEKPTEGGPLQSNYTGCCRISCMCTEMISVLYFILSSFPLQFQWAVHWWSIMVYLSQQDTEVPTASAVVEGAPALNRVSWTPSGLHVTVGDDMGKIWVYDVGEVSYVGCRKSTKFQSVGNDYHHVLCYPVAHSLFYRIQDASTAIESSPEPVQVIPQH